jgi:hypothetical protein
VSVKRDIIEGNSAHSTSKGEVSFFLSCLHSKRLLKNVDVQEGVLGFKEYFYDTYANFIQFMFTSNVVIW